MGQKNILLKFLSAIFLSLAVFFVYQVTYAFTLPTCNPPNCTGVLGGFTTGNLSIGTTNPEGLFQIASSTAIDVKLVIERYNLYRSAILRFNTTNLGSDWSIGLLNGNGAATNGFGISKTNYATDAKFMLTDGTFNVGIGTTNPLYKLDVVGDINYTGTFRQNGVAFSGSQWTTSGSNLYYGTGSIGVGLTSPDANYRITTSGGGIKAESSTQPAGYFSSATGYALLTGTGNVGIGTTAPAKSLVVSTSGSTGSSYGMVRLINTTANNESSIGFNNGTDADSLSWVLGKDIGNTSNKHFGFYYGGEKLVITTAGNVGIGTTAPSAKLDIQYANAAVSGLRLKNTETSGGDWYFNENAGAGKLTLYGGSTPGNKVVVDALGNVGIGTVTPTSILHLYSTSVSGTNLQLQNADTGGTAVQLVSTGSANNEGAGALSILTGGSRRLTIESDGGVAIGSYAGSSNNAPTNGLTVSGNVGIGTTAPAVKLDVNGSGSFGGNNSLIYFPNDTYKTAPGTNNSSVIGRADNAGYHVTGSVAGDLVIGSVNGGLTFGTGNTVTYSASRMRIDNIGNIGIGLTSPDANYKLTTSGGGIKSESTTQPAGYFNSTSGYGLLVNTGNVGIGTTAPTNKLHIASSDASTTRIKITNSVTTNGFDLQIGVDGTAYLVQRENLPLNFYTNNAFAMGILANGYVGIGMTPSYQLQLSTDSAAKPGTNTWTIASDARIKKDIRPFTEGLSVINNIKPVWYQYNGKGGFAADGKDYIGVIAQDIEKIAPYTVSSFEAKLNSNDDTTTTLYNFNSHALTFNLINAVKEQQKQIEELKNRISELEAKIK
ncbi:MAG: tail fiber domain-containing protein [Minisyncoccota bacterium]